MKRLLDNEHTNSILKLLLKDPKIVKDQASLIGYMMKELNHYYCDLSWLIMRCNDQNEVYERIFEDEAESLKCQLIKQAKEKKEKIVNQN